ncbi:hypothetical protein, partial [Paenibacillus riograndensis]
MLTQNQQTNNSAFRSNFSNHNSSRIFGLTSASSYEVFPLPVNTSVQAPYSENYIPENVKDTNINTYWYNPSFADSLDIQFPDATNVSGLYITTHYEGGAPGVFYSF